jgi:hypothetical protein
MCRGLRSKKKSKYVLTPDGCYFVGFWTLRVFQDQIYSPVQT